MRLSVLLLLAACASAGARVLSEQCSGFEPSACLKIPACTTCWDGRRVECFSVKHTVYGNLWCEASGRNDACAGQSEAGCGKTKGCVFCKSAAVGNQCYPTDEAKKLPAAIFSCAWKSLY